MYLSRPVSTLALVICITNQAFADPILPDATYTGSIVLSAEGSNGNGVEQFTPSQSVNAPGNVSFSGSEPGSSVSASITVGSNPSPSIYISGAASTAPVNGSVAAFDVHGEITYYLEVSGSPGTVEIGVNAKGGTTLNAVGSGIYLNGSFFSGFAITGNPVQGDIASQICCTNPDRAAVSETYGYGFDVSDSATFSDTSIYTIQTNEIYEVALMASIYGAVWGGLGGGVLSETAWVDPTFTIISDNPNQYSLTLSQGIGNSDTAIPEPASLVLLGVSVPVTLMTRRRRRSQA